ncbi:DUF362 domain-containing protein [Candidatus Latescibacterota bacterium]
MEDVEDFEEKGKLREIERNSWKDSCYGSRRDFIQKVGAGIGGLSMLSFVTTGCASRGLVRGTAASGTMQTRGESRVHLVGGRDHRQNVYNAIKPFQDQLKNEIAGKKVLIKVNFVGTGNQLAVTPPDAVRGTMDILNEITDEKIIVGDSKGFLPSFEHYNYLPLKEEFDNIVLEDLWKRPVEWYWILDSKVRPTPIRCYQPYFDDDYYIISLTRLKTHNAVVATLTLKNLTMGMPMKRPDLKVNDKAKMHAFGENEIGPKMINYNQFMMANRRTPDFCVLDGTEGLEGNGPTSGEPVDHQVALAGFDTVSVDRIGSELMGIPWDNIGYLQYCSDAGIGQGERDKINVTGLDPKDHVETYKLHTNIETQYMWKQDLFFKE